MTLAAIVAVVLLTLIDAFQLSLALGAPLGSASWGGKHKGVLPLRLRVASGVVGIVVYPLTIVFVLASSELIDVEWLPTGRIGMWIVVAIFTIGAVANLASRSKIERVWGPVSLVIAICAAVIAVRM
jgi:hypothetical protein